jgi:hypothetical protein
MKEQELKKMFETVRLREQYVTLQRACSASVPTRTMALRSIPKLDPPSPHYDAASS